MLPALYNGMQLITKWYIAGTKQCAVYHIMIHRVGDTKAVDIVCGIPMRRRQCKYQAQDQDHRIVICSECMRIIETPAYRDMLEHGFSDEYERPSPLRANCPSDPYINYVSNNKKPSLDWYDRYDDNT